MKPLSKLSEEKEWPQEERHGVKARMIISTKYRIPNKSLRNQFLKRGDKGLTRSSWRASRKSKSRGGNLEEKGGGGRDVYLGIALRRSVTKEQGVVKQEGCESATDPQPKLGLKY